MSPTRPPQTPVRPPEQAESVPGPTAPAGDDHTAVRREKLLTIPPRQRPIFRRAWRGKSRKAAMRAFCLECMGYQSAEVNRCTAPTCPLYPYREDRL